MRYIKIKLLVGFIFLLLAVQAFGYDNFTTHPLLSESAAVVYNKRADVKLTDQQKEWIIKGSINEDADPRYMNHFYDPTTGKGLDGWDAYKQFNIKVQGKSAKQWAKTQDSATGDYSESVILKNYQNGDLSRAYQGIGHILHLIEDMAVPAHTRNDPHAAGDPYEQWVEQYGTIDSSRLNFLAVDNLDQTFDELAHYSHNNFLSKDTINLADYKYNKIIKTKNEEYLSNTIDGVDYRVLLIDNSALIPVYILDKILIHQDYWNMLYPKAVGYSAGVIDYFVKQFAKIDQAKKEQEQISFFNKLKNSLAGLINKTEYIWGDVYMAQNKVLASGYDNFTALTSKAKNSLQFSYSYIKPNEAKSDSETPLQITTQDKPAGRVLAASESASPADRQAGQGEAKPQIPQAFNKGGENAKPVQTVNVPAVKQTAIAKTVNPKIPPAPFAKGGEAKHQIPPTPPPRQAAGETGFNKGGEIPESQIPLTPFAKGGEIHRKGSDSIPPETSLISYPNTVSSSTVSEFVFSSNEADVLFFCDLDNAGWQECGVETNINNLSDGSHNLKVIAEDSSNNADQTPAEYSWIIDTAAPTSSVAELLAEYPSTGFSVSWSGTDGQASTTSGLADFDIQYKIDSEEWQNWIMATTTTQAVFDIPVDNGSSVYFRSRSRDSAGNLENWPDNENGDARAAIAESEEIPEISESLVHLWHFDECEGDSINDSVGDDNMPQNFIRIVGKWQCAIRQSWQAQYDMEKTFSAPLPAGELTFSFYWRNSDWPNEGRNHIYFKDAAGQVVAGIQPSIQTRHLYFNSSATTSIPAMPNDGYWHMITAAYSLNGLALYVDGSQEAFFSGDYAVAGQIASMEMKGENFPVDIDEMAVWARALSADEIAGIYNSNSPIEPYNPPVQPGAAQIIHRWNFDEGIGNSASDNIGGTILNHNASWVAGKFGSGIEHTYSSYGVDNVISQSISPEITSRDLSIDFWWKNISFPNDGMERVILKNNAGENIFGIRISDAYYPSTTGRYYLNGEAYMTGDIAQVDGDWHHVAMVYDSYNFYMRIYIDGEEKIKLSHIWLDSPIQEISIYAESFPCHIDELEIWQGALTAEQVLDIYQK